ncbi:UDP-N-acetylmuramate dehydrogenase [Chryseolinea lacunae]|uniref:UDP-N-acetylenolpyruvoylglucosamine reductase n=1 Tax=Chryseolinea lacunae TaxID=2801331 RepID=A0ABS1KX71_9BACT|nr:UDP-N-acetylmuramate dehydrogenase [Chryseolinea lacunae]MBL0743803.1 UDP-N-acetylmuramate dehydrogenase [Chryseolinea lacunae]
MKVQENVELLPYNTFGIKAKAKHFTTVGSIAEAQALLTSDLFRKEKHFFLGGGSNVLLTKDYDGLVVKVEMKGKDIVREDDDTVTLKVGAGENWHALVMHCVAQGWGGVENLSLIPGTSGAAPMQNIGAYGVEIKKNIFGVETLEIGSGNVVNFSNEACQFGYRESIFKHDAKDKFLISSITLTLTKRNHKYNISYGAIEETLKQNGVGTLSVKDISDAVIHIRQTKLPDPSRIGNAGSFFKNPSIHADLHDFLQKRYPSIPSYPAPDDLIKIPAAWLIEQCGWKGKRFDNIGVHEHQPLVLVNYGGGEGEKIWELAMNIQASVKEKFDIVLHPEVNVL